NQNQIDIIRIGLSGDKAAIQENESNETRSFHLFEKGAKTYPKTLPAIAPLKATESRLGFFERTIVYPRRQKPIFVERWKHQFGHGTGVSRARSSLSILLRDFIRAIREIRGYSLPAQSMTIHRSRSPEQTLAYGEQLGRTAQPGMVIGLIGDL